MLNEKIETGKLPLGYKTKLQIVLAASIIVGILLLTLIYQVVAKNFFFQSSSVQLKQFCAQTKKNFLGDLGGEIKLALQMAKSPLSRSYCQDPSDKTLSELMAREMNAYASSFLSGNLFYISDTDRVFHSTEGKNYLLNLGIPENSWYSMTLNMNDSESYNFNINYNTEYKVTNFWINAVVRTREKGKAVGVVGTGIPLTKFISQIYADKNPSFELFFFNDKMEIVGAQDLSLIEKKSLITDETPRKVSQKIEKIMNDKRRAEFETFHTGKGVFFIHSIPEVGWNILAYRECSSKILFSGASVAFYFILIVIMMAVAALIYSTLLKFQKMREDEVSLGNNLFEETQNLVVAAKETAATSQDQSAAVKEIVATMEDSNNLSENISDKIEDVAMVAKKTSSDVIGGASSLATNVKKLREIFEANQQTINGIKALSEKIDNIWDIVTLINSVADQAKIIAFNAELEASSAGEAGKNFHIVASEIRRLADGIIDGTKEIKERINEIQRSSDSLILASEGGTVKINEGCDSAQELENKFSSIRSAAEITADSAEEITSIIQQQTAASGQILITLKQIAAGVENFTAATENVSSSAELLKGIAGKLNQQVEKGTV